MDSRLLLLSPEGEIRQAYHSEIEKLNIQFDTVLTFKELFTIMAKRPYNGIMLDLNTKLRAPKDEIDLVKDILEQFPVAELRWDTETEKIGIYYQGQSKDGGSLGDFASRRCREFDSRKFGIEKRERIQFNVTLARKNDFSEGNFEQSVTIDASRGGCFIFTINKWEVMSDAWFIIKELNDQTPIRGEVRWTAEWGKGLHFPGIGLLFKDIKDSQRDEICNYKPRAKRSP